MDCFKDGVLHLGKDRFKLNFAEETPYIQKVGTNEKILLKVHDICRFEWRYKGVQYKLFIDRANTDTIPKDNTIEYMTPIKISTKAV